MPLPPDGQVAEFDKDTAAAVVRVANFAVSAEAIRPVPVSSIRNPDGSAQPETMAEHDHRIVRTALLHLLEQGLVVFPPDITVMLDDFIPVERVGKD